MAKLKERVNQYLPRTRHYYPPKWIRKTQDSFQCELFLQAVILSLYLHIIISFRRRSSVSNPSVDKENLPPPTASRLYGGTPKSVDRLTRPFKCPGSAAPSRQSEKPARKRRKVSYADGDGSKEDGDAPWANEERLALANRENNKFPVFKVKDKEQLFRQRFAVPLINKDAGNYNPFRPAPTLGMRTGAIFVPKPLHDPCGEFAIVLYDPTIDGKSEPPKVIEANDGEEKKPVLDTPLMHKSLADILGLKKKVDDHPKIPVVIDPRLAKVLRPHQVEGVKVHMQCFSTVTMGAIF